MNKFVILLVGLTIGLVSPPVTPAPVEKIAYDTCWYYDGGGYYSCYIQVANADGSSPVYVPAEATEPAWSPDGSRLAFTDLWGDGIWVWNPDDSSMTPLNPDMYYAASPAWAPDGQRIAYSSPVTGSMELYASHINGGTTPLTSNAGVIGSPAWSPDGARIAFDCEIVPGNYDICSLVVATGVITRLTSDSASDTGPAWSPDGTRLAFATTRFGGVNEIAVMNADGSQVSRLGQGVAGHQPAWSPTGNRIAFQTGGGPCDGWGFCVDAIYHVNVDGTGQTFIAYGFNAALAASSAVFGRPIASIYYSCTGLTCNFSGTGSWDYEGPITGYSWAFSDGGSGTGGTMNHTFPSAGTYSVTLTVVDSDGHEGTTTISAQIVILPQAVIAVSCTGLTCTYDGSGSFDADGTIVDFTWGFGDSTLGSGPVVTHTYATGNQYQIWLRVTDNSGGINYAYSSVTVSMAPHVGDLDGSSTGLKANWTPAVSITVHNANHQAMANVTVNGIWSTNASGSCVTNGIGQCSIYSAQQKNSVASVTFTVTGLQVQYGTYNPAANHDPDGDSNGTRITIRKR